MTTLTAKAERTRQVILETALEMFAKRGYEAATMRDIAVAANVSLGLAYRYFEGKESLVLALYQQMAAQTDAAISDLAPGSISDRFIATMMARLENAAPYRHAFKALFGTIMTPGTEAGLLGTEAGDFRRNAEQAFIRLVENSTDALKSAQAQNFGKLLYAIHFAILFFWLHDRSKSQKTTQELLDFIHRGLPMLRQGMTLRVISAQVARFIRIIEEVLGTR
jgi:AcrR family transcriptional regulator